MHSIREHRMVRVTGLAFAGLVAVLAPAALSAQQAVCAPPMRLAYINSQAILANTPGRAEAESLFTREMAGFRAEAQQLQARLDSAIAEYNRTSVALTPTARQARETEIRNMQTRAATRTQELDRQAQSREAELTGPIMQRVNAVIEGVRAEFNCAFIFDAAAQGSTVVTADRALDLSALIVQRLQAAAPARDTTAAAAPAAQPPVGQRPPAAQPTLRPQQPPPTVPRRPPQQ